MCRTFRECLRSFENEDLINAREFRVSEQCKRKENSEDEQKASEDRLSFDVHLPPSHGCVTSIDTELPPLCSVHRAPKVICQAHNSSDRAQNLASLWERAPRFE